MVSTLLCLLALGWLSSPCWEKSARSLDFYRRVLAEARCVLDRDLDLLGCSSTTEAFGVCNFRSLEFEPQGESMLETFESAIESSSCRIRHMKILEPFELCFSGLQHGWVVVFRQLPAALLPSSYLGLHLEPLTSFWDLTTRLKSF